MLFLYRIGKIFIAWRDLPFRIKFLIIGIISTIIILVYGINFITKPAKTKFTPLPFNNGQCLFYERYAMADTSSFITEKVCYEVNNGVFTELNGNILSTSYNSKGITNLTEKDIETWKKALNDQNKPVFIGAENEKMMKKMRNHSKYYGPINVKIGELFYNNSPITQFTEFNGESAYTVELYSWKDISHNGNGIISKNWWKFISYLTEKRLNRFNKIKSANGDSENLMEKFYYSRKTGILLGWERLWVKTDKYGNISSYESSKSKNNQLIKLKNN